MDIYEAKKIALEVDKILGCDGEVCDFDEETVYVNTKESSLDFDALLEVRKRFRIEAISVDDLEEGYLVLQIDVRTQEQRLFDKEAGDELMGQTEKMISGTAQETFFKVFGYKNGTSYGVTPDSRGYWSLPVSKFGNITSMQRMFSSIIRLSSLDLDNLDTSKVTDMSYMFYTCLSFSELNLNGWDTGCVTSMDGMFASCESLTYLDLSGFDTSQVTSMDGMFQDSKSLTSLDLSGWNTRKAFVQRMFSGCWSLKTIRMKGCSQDTIDKIKAQLAKDGIYGVNIITE